MKKEKMNKMSGKQLGEARPESSGKAAPMAAHNLPHKGMKAPRPASHSLGDVRKAPASQPGMNHKEPSHPMKAGDQSMAPSSKKGSLPSQDAPEGVKGVNGGMSHALGKVGRDQIE